MRCKHKNIKLISVKKLEKRKTYQNLRTLKNHNFLERRDILTKNTDRCTLRHEEFIKTLNLIRKGKKNLFLIVLFDVLFLAAIYGIVTLFSYIPPLTNVFAGILLSIFYFLLLVFAYSFFKYNILEYVVSFVRKKESDYKLLKEFYILNLLIFAPILVILLLINILLVLLLKTQSLPIISSIISSLLQKKLEKSWLEWEFVH